jgi:molybdate transport system ATP-binding protein
MTGTSRGAALSAEVGITRGLFDLDMRLDVAAGGCLAVFGPNGAGKSTMLAALAGLIPLQSGEVRLDGRVLEQAGRVRLRPEQRRVTLLEQKPRLFPHLTVRQNIEFGPRAQGRGRREAFRAATEWLTRIGLAEKADARPHELSGGQQQRVAVARAFAADPRVLLLDEPFSALDAESGPAVRRLLSEELARTGTTSVLVTHELADAWPWADDCLVLDRGRVVDSGTPRELATRPRHPFTAALAGFCVVSGTWRGGSLVVSGIPLAGTSDVPLAPGAPAFGIVAPRDVVASATRGRLRTTLRSVSAHAGSVRLESTIGLTAELPLEDALALRLHGMPEAGDELWLTPQGMRVVADHDAPVRGA